jgi:hypothetical protein
MTVMRFVERVELKLGDGEVHACSLVVSLLAIPSHRERSEGKFVSPGARTSISPVRSD